MEKGMTVMLYRPHYHASVPSGWANDPNGTIFYRGRAHLFYQHYPHKAEWGTMHWGHFVTDDFVHWENLPVALRPDQEYEALCGCCSGSAIERDGKLYLLYTAAQPERQRQCLAWSEDGGVTFVKDADNPILTAEMLDDEVSTMDFRDPRLFRKDGLYYAIAGARIVDPAKQRAAGGGSARPSWAGEQPSRRPVRSPSIGDVSGTDPDKDGYGNMILIKSPDLKHWTYVGKLLLPQKEFSEEFYLLNGVYECPDYFVSNGREVLLSSPQNLPQMGNAYQNIHSALYMLGALDFASGAFHVDMIGEVDSGFDFYAAQTLQMPDGRIILIAWKEMWDRTYPTQKEGWAGTYTLPRELRVEGDRLIQTPVREIEKYRQGRVFYDAIEVRDGAAVTRDGLSGNCVELHCTLEPDTAARCGVKVFCGGGHETRIFYDRASGLLVFDRSQSGLLLKGREEDVNRRVVEVGQRERLDLRLFLDVCSVELFADGGRYCMTGNVYPDEGDTGVEFFAEGGTCRFLDVEKFDIVV